VDGEGEGEEVGGGVEGGVELFVLWLG